MIKKISELNDTKSNKIPDEKEPSENKIKNLKNAIEIVKRLSNRLVVHKK